MDARGRRALCFALAPTLLIYGTMNWDLLAVALATAGDRDVLPTAGRWRRGRCWGSVWPRSSTRRCWRCRCSCSGCVTATPTGRCRLCWCDRRGLAAREPPVRDRWRPSAWFGRSSASTPSASRISTASGTWRCRHVERLLRDQDVNVASLALLRGALRDRVVREGAQRPGVPAVDAGLPDAGAVPAHEQGLLAAVRAVAAAVVRAGLAAVLARSWPSRSPTCGVRDPVLVLRRARRQPSGWPQGVFESRCCCGRRAACAAWSHGSRAPTEPLETRRRSDPSPRPRPSPRRNRRETTVDEREPADASAPSAARRVRDCVLVFLGVRVGLSVLSLAGDAADRAPPGVPTVAGVAPSARCHVGVARRRHRHGTPGRRVVPADRDRRLRGGDGSAAFFPLYPMADRGAGLAPGRRPARRGDSSSPTRASSARW